MQAIDTNAIEIKHLPLPSPYRATETIRTRHHVETNLSVTVSHADETTTNRSPTTAPNIKHKMRRQLPILHQADIDSIETFVIFLGWQRSCHSMVGSMLDAHPNVIIAHEYKIFEKLKNKKHLVHGRSRVFNELYWNSYRTNNDPRGWRNSHKNQKGYSLHIDGWWQGRFTTLKVIGDKGGGSVARAYAKNSEQFQAIYQLFSKNVKVPIKILQVVRNPFDMIATHTLYEASSIPAVKVRATPTQKYSNFAILNQTIDYYMRTSAAIFQMIPELQLSPLKVHCEDLISHPAETMSQICQFLNLECSREYLQMCAEKTFKNISASHLLVEWDPTTLMSLKRNILKFPFFQRYNNTQGLP